MRPYVNMLHRFIKVYLLSSHQTLITNRFTPCKANWWKFRINWKLHKWKDTATLNLLGLGGGKPGIKPCWACWALFEAAGGAGGWCWIVWFISPSTSIADPTAAAAAAAAVPPPPTVYSSLTNLPPGPTPTPDCRVRPDRSVKNGSVRGKPTHSIKTPKRPQQSMIFFSLVFCIC